MIKKFRGSLLGVALGDAIGEIAQHDMTRIHRTLEDILSARARFEWTDDTAMTIGLAETLIADGGIDGERLSARFHAHWSAEPWRGYAGGPPTVFALAEKDGISYRDAANRVSAAIFHGEGSWGNGGAMRAAPVGLFFAGNEDLYERAAESARPTHTHPLGIEGAALIAKAVSLALAADPAAAFDRDYFVTELRSFCRTPGFRLKLDLMAEFLVARISDSEAAKRLVTDIAALETALESVPFALWSFLNHPYSFEDCLSCAVMNGGDADTLGAMACGISGAYLGEEALPGRWKDKLEEGDYVARLAGGLYRRMAESPESADASARQVFDRLKSCSVVDIKESDYYRKHVSSESGPGLKIDFAELTPVPDEGPVFLGTEEIAELLECDPLIELRDRRRIEMKESGAWFHSNGEAVARPWFVALGRHQWYVPFAESLARRYGSEVYLLDFMVWPDMDDPQDSLLWFIKTAERIDVNLRGITPEDLRRATSGAGGSKVSRQELGIGYMTSWEMNRVFCDDYLGITWWHTGGSMSASQAYEALGGCVARERIVENDPAGDFPNVKSAI